MQLLLFLLRLHHLFPRLFSGLVCPCDYASGKFYLRAFQSHRIGIAGFFCLLIIYSASHLWLPPGQDDIILHPSKRCTSLEGAAHTGSKVGYLKCRDQDIIAGYDRRLTVFNLGLQPCFGVRATLILWDLWLSRELCYCHFIVFSYKVIFWEYFWTFPVPWPLLNTFVNSKVKCLRCCCQMVVTGYLPTSGQCRLRTSGWHPA